MSPSPLPIEPALPELAAVLGHAGAAVLQAPPGAGKTTRVPLALLSEPWLAGRRILLLEPRRVAARAAARRMAQMLGERPGQTIGYRIRRESVVGPATRIEVVTEGILTRLLQADPALPGIGLVIFDEFHERSIHADLGLALALHSRQLLRPDLRLLVMSATLDGGPIAALLGGAPVVTSEGRAFPVETRYLPRRPDGRLEASVASAIRTALAEQDGDVLAFLPGAGEIRRTADLLDDLLEIEVLPLHGNLTGQAQDQAILPGPPGRRKVVLATAIAETSLTIQGVRVVIDGGLARVPRFSPRTGMTRLTTVRVSRASADQRRGRAGRESPGVCYRLWAAAEDHHLIPQATPEIMEADLASLALELKAMGADPADLGWLDPPPDAAYGQALTLLRQLDALDGAGRITTHGRLMANLGTHPRLAHLLLRGRALGAGELAATLVALLEERDILRPTEVSPDPDVQLRLDLVATRDTPPTWHGSPVDRGTLQRVRQEARAWASSEQRIAVGTPRPQAGVLLALAYPDRVAKRRADQAGRFVLRNGQGAETGAPSLALEDYLVAAQLDGERRQSRIWLAAPLKLEEILTHFGDQIELEQPVEWSEADGVLRTVRRDRLGALILRETAGAEVDPLQAIPLLLNVVRREGLGFLPWAGGAEQLRQRLNFVERQGLPGGPWPEVSDAALLQSLEIWLAPQLAGVRRRADFSRIDLSSALVGLLSWEQRRQLDHLAPTHLTVPTGSRVPIDYADPSAPVLAVRLQEVFGLSQTPAVGGGKIPVTLHLLSPARRPVQVTRDLAGFWRSSYFDVKKEMKGRYPRHYWPDDPLMAEPTRRVKPSGKTGRREGGK